MSVKREKDLHRYFRILGQPAVCWSCKRRLLRWLLRWLLRVHGSPIINGHLPVDDVLDPDGPVVVRFGSEHPHTVGIPAPGERDVELAMREDVLLDVDADQAQLSSWASCTSSSHSGASQKEHDVVLSPTSRYSPDRSAAGPGSATRGCVFLL